MSVPRVALVPTHSTGLADAIAGAVVEIIGVQGREARYHHMGPLAPAHAWDKWEGAAFIDPTLSGEKPLAGLYDVAVRHADLSLLSASVGLLDEREEVGWTPAELAALLDCPVVLVMDCRGWGTGIRALIEGVKDEIRSVDLAGAILTGVADREHCELLRKTLAEEDVLVAGCLYQDQGPAWDTSPPGAWGVPLAADFLESVAKQVDVDGLEKLAGRRGFFTVPDPVSAPEPDGPVVAVASGKGFTPWSRDSIEVLREAGAQVRRLDLLEDLSVPEEAAGLVLAGTLWPETIADVAMNTALIQDIAARVEDGLPTLALGGGTALMLDKVQDTLGRTGEFTGVVPAQAEILWDLETAAYVEVISRTDNLLLAEGAKVKGWVLTELEMVGGTEAWEPALELRAVGTGKARRGGAGSDSLFCSPALLHLAAQADMAPRFVDRCRQYAETGGGASGTGSALGQ